MTTVVLDSSDLVEHVLTGKTPEPPSVTADNAAQAAKAEAKIAPRETPEQEKQRKSATGRSATADELAKLSDADDPDNVPDERDGITPRQRRIFTKEMQATIAKKHHAAKEAESRAEAEYNRSRMAEERAAKLQERIEALERAAKPAPVEEGPPNRTKFETDEAYQDALIDYRVDQRLKKQQAEADQRAAERQQAEVVAQAQARVERARELIPDWQETVAAISDEIPLHIAGIMEQSELLPEIAYHFAKNPAELVRLSAYTEGLTPGSQAWSRAVSKSLVDFGKIEAKLSPFVKASSPEPDTKAPNGAEPKSITGTAPSKPPVRAPIIRPLDTGSESQVEKAPAEMSYAEARAAWERQSGVKLAVRKRH